MSKEFEMQIVNRAVKTTLALSLLFSIGGQGLSQTALADSSRSVAAVDTGSGIIQTWGVLPSLYMQSLFIKFNLHSYGKSDAEKIQVMKDAEAAIIAFSKQKRMVVRVETLAELEKVKSLFFPRFNSLADEIEIRRSGVQPGFFLLSTSSTDVENEIESLWKNQEAVLASVANLGDALKNARGNFSVRRTLLSLVDNADTAQAGLALVPDSTRLQVANLIQAEVAKGIARIESTGTVLGETSAINHPNPALKRFFTLAIGEYFKHLDQQTKIEIISAFIDKPDRSSPRERFEIMVMNAGPQFQKLFQVYAREEGFGEEMKHVFKQLENTARPAPWRLVKPLIDRETVPFRWVEIDPQPFGVGTMAQVHRAKVRLASGEEKSVVVRVLKPGIEAKVKNDNDVLSRVAPAVDADPFLRQHNFPRITPFVSEISQMVMHELSVASTVKNQKEGAAIYTRDINIGKYGDVRFRVPKVYELDPRSPVMVQEYLDGISFEKFASQQPELALKSIEELAKLWVEQALVETGFYHADLHQGNLKVHQMQGGAQINILDFGMTGRLDRQMQTRIIALALVLESRNVDYMARALWELSLEAQNTITFAELKKNIASEIERIDKNRLPYSTFGEWVGYSANLGLKFPSQFTSLNRGLALVMQMLWIQKSSLDLAKILPTIIMRHPKFAFDVVNSMNSMGHRDWAKIMVAKFSPYMPDVPWPSLESVRANVRSCRDFLTTSGGH